MKAANKVFLFAVRLGLGVRSLLMLICSPFASSVPCSELIVSGWAVISDVCAQARVVLRICASVPLQPTDFQTIKTSPDFDAQI